MKLVCKKGWHDFLINGIWPQIPKFFNKKTTLRWEITMDELSKYTLPGEDWRDWNKGGGQTFNWFNHLIDTAMWGFRYNSQINMFEFAAYCHVDGVKVLGTKSGRAYNGDKEVMFQSVMKETVLIELYIDWDKKLYKFRFGGNATQVPFTHNCTLGKEITANFGGNNAAPSKVITDIKTTY